MMLTRHLLRNVASAMRTSARTIWFGRFWSDASACRDLGMMPAAFCGFDSQSDYQSAIFLNPYHLIDVKRGEDGAEEICVPRLVRLVRQTVTASWSYLEIPYYILIIFIIFDN